VMNVPNVRSQVARAAASHPAPAKAKAKAKAGHASRVCVRARGRARGDPHRSWRGHLIGSASCAGRALVDHGRHPATGLMRDGACPGSGLGARYAYAGAKRVAHSIFIKKNTAFLKNERCRIR
jgi:hypothetical protein